jgi:predicted nicotinamide N-methyase
MSELDFRAVPFSALGIELFLPDPVQVKAAYESGERRGFPYWSKIWASSLALATWLKEEPGMIAGKNILEIGAGIGLPSFIASLSGSSLVTISDHIPEAIEWMDLNISNNRLQHVKSRLVDWTLRPLPVAEVVLLSDIGYEEQDFPDIREMIQHYLLSGAMILLSVPARIISVNFVKLMDEFVVTSKRVSSMDTEILLLQLGVTDARQPVQKLKS